MNNTIYDFAQLVGLEDKVVDLEQIPWIPQSDRVWFKPVRFDLTNGKWINLLKVKPGGKVNRHRHTGGSVLAYTLQGSWYYLEREWKAKPGTFVFEPPGDIHTLIVEGEEEMISLFILEGSIQYLNDHDEVTSQDDVFSKLKRYVDYCDEFNVPIQDLKY